jgi:hypothetical protein
VSQKEKRRVRCHHKHAERARDHTEQERIALFHGSFPRALCSHARSSRNDHQHARAEAEDKYAKTDAQRPSGDADRRGSTVTDATEPEARGQTQSLVSLSTITDSAASVGIPGWALGIGLGVLVFGLGAGVLMVIAGASGVAAERARK